MGTLSADLTGVRRFGSPVLPLFRCGNRALSIPVVRCWRQMLISTAIPYNFKNSCENLGVQTRRLVDVEVVDVTVAAHVHVGQRTAEARPTRHIAIPRVGQV
jgi:hypothetical protein